MNDNPGDISSLELSQFLEEMEANCFLIRLIALVIFFTYLAREIILHLRVPNFIQYEVLQIFLAWCILEIRLSRR